jgi:hypothetical protein
VRGKHKHYDSRGSVSAEKLPVIFSEEMRTSSGKYWETYILGLAAPGICGNGLQIYIGVSSLEAMDFCEEYVLMRHEGQPKIFCNSPKQ